MLIRVIKNIYKNLGGKKTHKKGLAIILMNRHWNTLDWILPPLEQLMTYFTPSLTLFLEKTFCLISLDTSLLVL